MIGWIVFAVYLIGLYPAARFTAHRLEEDTKEILGEYAQPEGDWDGGDTFVCCYFAATWPLSMPVLLVMSQEPGKRPPWLGGKK